MSTRSIVSSPASAASATQPQTNTYVAPPVPVSSAFPAASIAPSTAVNGSLEPTNEGVPPVEVARPVKKGKGFGKRLTDRERVEILELIEKSGGSLTNSEVARRYGITRAAIQKLKAKGPEVRARYRYGSVETRDDRKRGGHVMSVPFEQELYEWVRGLKARKVPVPPSLVKEKAKLLVPKYGLGNFQASNGWYYNFCRRFNLIAAALVGDKAAEEDTNLDADHSPQLQQMAEMPQPTMSVYEQQLQQYQHQMAAIAAVTLQQQQEQVEEELQHQVHEKQQQLQREADATQATQSKSDRMLKLLEQQNVLLERQNSMIQDQAKTIKKLYAVVTKDTAL